MLPCTAASRLSCAVVLSVIVSFTGSVFAQAPKPDPAAQLKYDQNIAPFLKKYCSECHSGDQADAGIAVDKLTEKHAKTKDRNLWKRIAVQLEGAIMPPADAPQPPKEERELIAGWIRNVALPVDCGRTATPFPGRVTLRRLNRAEYNNTIRDLVGIDFQPADSFPSDDVGYGFDNIGDVLTLPPVLFERYLEAADEIARRAIVSGDEDSAPVKKFEDGTLGSRGEKGGEIEVAEDNQKFLFQIVASGDQAGPDPCKMALKLNGKEGKVIAVKGKRGAEETFTEEVTLKKGKQRLSVEFLNDYYEPDSKDPKLKGDRNLHIVSLKLIGPLGVLPDKLPESHTRIIQKTPGPKATRAQQIAAARTNIEAFATKAFRRPVQPEELTRLVKFAEAALIDKQPFEGAMRLAVTAILTSPNFIFKIEQDPLTSDVRALTDLELATRLSYFLWSSCPDDELLNLAKENKLGTSEGLAKQVQRMLKDPKSRALADNFASQWLHLRQLDRVSPDPRRFPSFDSSMRSAMKTETVLFFDAIVRDDRNIMEFLSSDYTFVNNKLAGLYGIKDINGEEFQKVSLDPSQRGGLMGQASILTVTSNPTRTSPVKRGRWILENLLAAPPPPAPANVPPLEEPGRREKDVESLRKRLELHRSNPACASCHKIMDPLGFGLENYDAIGAWRTKDRDNDIDSSGELPSGQKFNGPAELRKVLSEKSNDFRRCLTEKLLTYALGRGLEYFDECTIADIASKTQRGGDKFSALVTAIVQSDPFRRRAKVAMPE
jgi:hypothetical protein